LSQELKKLDNENIKQYKIRLFHNKDLYELSSQGIADLINKETGDNFSESTYRKWYRSYSEGFEDGQKESLSDDNILKEYELKKQEFQKEKIKVQTEKLTLNQALREQARFELFIEKAVEAINNIEPIQIPEVIHKDNNIDKSGLLIFADPHYDKELTIKGLRGEILNSYSPEIFEQRMWKLLSETIRICKKEEFSEIDVFSMGDELEGMLRISQLMNLRYGLVESAIRYAYFIAEWLNKLSEHVKINFYSTEGNHTDVRLLTGKKGDFPHENMSKVIDTLIGEILKNNNNIKIYTNETDKIYVNIQGFNVLGLHGEEKNIMQSIRDYSFIYNERIDYLVSGHRHHANSVNAGISKGCIGVGSIIGIDDYSMELKRVSNASATFAVFEKGIGKTIEYNILLN
jgi:hypothetical protein